MEDIGGIVLGITVDLQGLDASFSKAETMAGQAGQKMANAFNAATESIGDRLGKLGAQFSSVGAEMVKVGGIMSAAISVPLIGIGSAAVKTAADFEQLKIGFTTLLGSAEKAEAVLKDLLQFAATTPFEIKGVEESAKRLLAFGVEAKDLIPTLRTLGDASSAMGGRPETFARVIDAMGKMRIEANLMSRDMNRLTADGIPAWDLLSKQMGVTTAELKKMVTDGAVPAKKAFDDLLAAMSGQYGGAMANQFNSLNQMISNLKDKITILAIEVGTEFLPAAKSMVEVLSSLVGVFSDLPEPVKRVSVTLLTIFAASGPIITGMGLFAFSLGEIMKVLSAIAPLFETVATTATTATTGMQALGAAIGTGAGGLTAGMLVLEGAVIAVGAAFGAWAIDAALTQIERLDTEIERLEGLLDKGAKASKEQAAAIAVMEQTLRAAGKEFDSTGKTISQYYDSLKAAVNQLDQFKDKQFGASKMMADGTLNLAEATREWGNFNGKVSDGSIKIGDAARDFLGFNSAIDGTAIKIKVVGEESEKAAAKHDTHRTRVKALGGALKETVDDADGFVAAVKRMTPAQEINAEVLKRQAAALQATSDKLKEQIIALRLAEPAYQAYLRSIENGNLALEAAAVWQQAMNREMGKVPSLSSDEERALRAVAEAQGTVFGPPAQADIQKTTADVAAHGTQVEKLASVHTRARQEINQMYKDLSRGIADAIVAGKGFGETFQKIFEAFEKAIIRLVIDKLLEATGAVEAMNKGVDKLLKSVGLGGGKSGGSGGGLLGTAKSGLGALTGLGRGASGSGEVGSEGSGLPTSGHPELLGEGSGEAGTTITQGGSGGGGGGSLGSLAGLPGVSDLIQLIAAVGSSIATIIQTFQLHGIGKDTGKMEESLRGILNIIGLNGDESVLGATKRTWQEVKELKERLLEAFAHGIGVFNQEGDGGLFVIVKGQQNQDNKLPFTLPENAMPATDLAQAAQDLASTADDLSAVVPTVADAADGLSSASEVIQDAAGLFQDAGASFTEQVASLSSAVSDNTAASKVVTSTFRRISDEEMEARRQAAIAAGFPETLGRNPYFTDEVIAKQFNETMKAIMDFQKANPDHLSSADLKAVVDAQIAWAKYLKEAQAGPWSLVGDFGYRPTGGNMPSSLIRSTSTDASGKTTVIYDQLHPDPNGVEGHAGFGVELSQLMTPAEIAAAMKKIDDDAAETRALMSQFGIYKLRTTLEQLRAAAKQVSDGASMINSFTGDGVSSVFNQAPTLQSPIGGSGTSPFSFPLNQHYTPWETGPTTVLNQDQLIALAQSMGIEPDYVPSSTQPGKYESRNWNGLGTKVFSNLPYDLGKLAATFSRMGIRTATDIPAGYAGGAAINPYQNIPWATEASTMDLAAMNAGLGSFHMYPSLPSTSYNFGSAGSASAPPPSATVNISAVTPDARVLAEQFVNATRELGVTTR